MASGALGNANAKAKAFRKPLIYAGLIYSKDSFMKKYCIKIEFLTEKKSFLFISSLVKGWWKFWPQLAHLKKIFFSLFLFKLIVHLDLFHEFRRQIRKHLTEVSKPEQLGQFSPQFAQHTMRGQSHHPLFTYNQDISWQTHLTKHLPQIYDLVLWC